ncbi:hypothetical protein AA0118_g12368 [Alternaria tenuissima]|uniref:Uncharacterized protein n=1 Tax=Alternaria tenuissima TaxID=119927 RepID=A0A4Q4MNY1_9PLEO|nr:hypothetical protein AA0111_g5442 [Alternaria arborescens]RYN46975.1 hypothetical protein AA0118_g12368 [Alternaria tenuissima]RYN55721.1 hypothetical protein AA0114_g3081 [Alternaria tenuissima]RYO30328.1 hypothetical protein AA0111_g5442 [Alternaria arborescens]RYO68548.1 hypothetical protein AA0116_g694 [Alternaria tenuissima]
MAMLLVGFKVLLMIFPMVLKPDSCVDCREDPGVTQIPRKPRLCLNCDATLKCSCNT